MQLYDFTLGELLEKYALETPDHDFMVYPDRDLRFSYAEFNDRVDRLAKGLLFIGVKRGDNVGIWAKNVPDWLTFMFATAKIGAVLVTVNTNYKLAELEYLMNNADLHTLCLVGGYRDSDYIKMVLELVPELKTDTRGNLNSAKFPFLKNVIYIGQEKRRGMYNTAELLLLGSHIDDAELEAVKSQVNTHDTVNMQYTSGTTGFPKGVMLSHHNILNNGYTVGECMHYTKDDKVLVCVPLFHCFGCVLAL
ncbi:MAG: AMP-binding protein, partial [Bacteroidota bacterium]|nr:AMP-binding protein [Bacteroidota bacterium]